MKEFRSFFYIWILLCLAKQVVTRGSSMKWMVQHARHRFPWFLFYLCIFLPLEKPLLFFSLASSFFPFDFSDNFYFKWGTCYLIKILLKVFMALECEEAFGVSRDLPYLLFLTWHGRTVPSSGYSLEYFCLLYKSPSFAL